MKSEKHKQKKKDIISTAFIVWNKSCYFSTSLNEIAEEMGITKQAIYRYFKNKKELLVSMEEQIIDDYKANLELILESINSLSSSESIRFYVLNQISFFRSHREYLTFLISKIRLKDNDQKDFLEVILKQSQYLQEKFSLPLSAINYILNLIVFYLLMGDKKETNQLAETINSILQNGFATELLTKPSDRDLILLKCRIPIDEEESENKILNAVSHVVFEEGPEAASMDKIAKKAGITKSSLYFYFKNKEEMIVKTINEKTESFIDFYHQLISSYSQIGDQLYAHFVLTASLTIEKPKTIPLIHWFITQGMAEKFKKPTDFEKYQEFFKRAEKEKYIEIKGVKSEQLLMLINFCITYEINNIHRKELNKEEKYKLINDLYDLFTDGLTSFGGKNK